MRFNSDIKWGWITVAVLFIIVNIVAYYTLIDKKIDYFNLDQSSKSRKVDRNVNEKLDSRPLVSTDYLPVDQKGSADKKFNNQLDEKTKVGETQQIYLKGLVDKFQDGVLSIKTDSQSHSVLVPEEIAVRCEKETITTQEGKVMPTSEIFIDYSRVNIDKVNKQNIGAISNIIKVGEKIGLIASSNSDGALEAKMIAGYGCELSREVNLNL